MRLEPPPTEPKPAPTPRKVHFDSFAADIQYGSTAVAVHNGVIAQGAAHLNIDGSAQLTNGAFTDSSPFNFQVQLRNATVADLQQTVGTNYPAAGIVNLTLNVSGTKVDPRGKGSISISSGEAYGYSIKTASSDIAVGGHEAQLQNLHIDGLDGHVTG